jgi:hypothetical protein
MKPRIGNQKPEKREPRSQNPEPAENHQKFFLYIIGYVSKIYVPVSTSRAGRRGGRGYMMNDDD